MVPQPRPLSEVLAEMPDVRKIAATPRTGRDLDVGRGSSSSMDPPSRCLTPRLTRRSIRSKRYNSRGSASPSPGCWTYSDQDHGQYA